MATVWLGHRKLFRDAHGDPLRRLDLAQVDEEHFALLTPFTFDSQTWGRIEARTDLLDHTDLATIPQPVAWFSSRHGLHTAAALIHDELDTHAEMRPHRPGSDQPIDREEVDDVFREAMEELGVSAVRRLIMWAGVVGYTKLTKLGWGWPRIAISIWLIVALAGMAGLGYVCATSHGWEWFWIIPPLLGPIIASPLWWPRVWGGVIAGLSLPFVAIPTVSSLLAFQAFKQLDRVWFWVSVRLRGKSPVEQPSPPRNR